MKETKCGDERATYVLSGGESWSIGLLAEGKEGGEEMR
jgi:hypothetical protein